MNNAPKAPEERYEGIVHALLDTPGVTRGGQGFGSSGLKVHNKIFAMLSSTKEFVVKLPRQRVDALVAAGQGERFDPRGDGRLMKEWLCVGPATDEEWLALAREALEFVASTGSG